MLGHFSEEAVEAFIQMSCEEKGLDYSETFDFARCQRPDGSFYGTRGTCKPPAKATSKLGKGRNVGERNRNARVQSASDKIAKKLSDQLGGKSKSSSSGRLDGKSAADALAKKKKLQGMWDKGGSKKSSSGGGAGGLSDAQLKAIFAKTGGGKGKKGMKGGRR
jgi:hypothetical protein